VVDGREGPTYDQLRGAPVFSPDSRRVAYVGAKGNECYLVLDGREYTRNAIDTGSLMFSPDSQRFVYVGSGGKFIVIDGKEEGKYLHVSHPVFSPDSQRLVYAVYTRQRMFQGDASIVGDGITSPKEEDLIAGAGVFSPDSKRLAYVAYRGYGWSVIVDGIEWRQGFWDEDPSIPVFSPDSKKFAYVAKHDNDGDEIKKVAVAVDGAEHQEYDEIIGTRVVFSPDSRRVAYVAKSGGSCFMVIDGQKYDGPFPRIRAESLLFSPDGQHVSYVVEEEGKCRVIRDGKPGKEYFEIEDGPHFSPDSRNLAYLATHGRDPRYRRVPWIKHFLVVEGSGETEYKCEGVNQAELVDMFALPKRRLFFDGVRAAYAWTVDGNAIRKVEVRLPR